MQTRIPASIEMAPHQAVEQAGLVGLFPANTRVYLTDIGKECGQEFVDASKRLRDCGYVPVPHIAARRLRSWQQLENRLQAMTQEGGVDDVLVVGGGLHEPAGVITSTMDVLESGLLDKYGIREIGIAGHPEGSPDFAADVAFEAMQLKQAFARRTDARMRIVTQFGFNAQLFIRWAQELKNHDVDLPVHVGVTGPAKMTTLLKYAVICGVGPSLQFLKKRASVFTTLVAGFDPELVVRPIEDFYAHTPDSPIQHIHVFPFGGVISAATWLKDRGSWVSAPLACNY